MDEEDFLDIYEVDSDTLYHFIEEHYKDLLDKYYDEVLEHFKERAVEEMERKAYEGDYDSDPYDDYDVYDDVNFDESLKNNDSFLMEDYDYYFPKKLAIKLKSGVKSDMTEEDYINLQNTLVDCWKALAEIGALEEEEITPYIEKVKKLSITPVDTTSYNSFRDYDDYTYEDEDNAQFEKE